MAADPPLMLMDEPFGAIDPITRERLQNDFLRLHREIRKTVVFVTHDIDEAIKMGDRIACCARAACSPSTTRRRRSSPRPPTSSWPSSSAPTAASSGSRCATLDDVELAAGPERRDGHPRRRARRRCATRCR